MKNIMNKLMALATVALLFGCETTGKDKKGTEGTNPPIVENQGENPDAVISKDFPTTELPPEVIQGEKIEHNFGPVYFAFDSAVVREEENAKLKMLASFLENNPNLYLVIEGHCDERGSEEYNRALSERRALAVKDFIEKNSQNLSARINTVGYGEEKLVDTEKTDLAHAKNRRAEFTIISKR